MKDLHTLDAYRVNHPFLKEEDGFHTFKVMVGQRSFMVIASVDDCGEDGIWEHVSVTPKNQKRCPTWEEMCAIKDMFFEPEEECVEFHPKHSEYINMHENCLHIWRPVNRTLTMPVPKNTGEAKKRMTFKDASGNWVIACNHFEDWVEHKYPAHIHGEAVDRLAAFEERGMEPEDILTGMELAEIACAMDLLKEYQSLGSVEDFRRLKADDKEVFCKSGVTVWRIVNDAQPHITKDKVETINTDGSFTLIGGRIVHKSDFGETVFFSQKRAEAVLNRQNF